jgi:hypothetical protein
MAADPRELLAAAERLAPRRTSLAAAALMIVGEIMFLMLDLYGHRGTLLPVLRLGHVAICAAVLVYLAPPRRGAEPAGSVTLALVFLPAAPIFWLAERQVAAAGLPWAPFAGHKLVMLGVALLAPGSLLVGHGLIATFALLAVATWYALGLDTSPLRIAGEPWVTVTYGLVSAGLLVYRARHRAAEQRLERSRGELAVMTRMARLLLALRDRANTPLQTIELAAGLLLRRHPDAAPEIERLRAALRRLRALSGRLGGYDELIAWRAGDESFDADEVLRRIETAGTGEPPR